MPRCPPWGQATQILAQVKYIVTYTFAGSRRPPGLGRLHLYLIHSVYGTNILIVISRWCPGVRRPGWFTSGVWEGYQLLRRLTLHTIQHQALVSQQLLNPLNCQFDDSLY